MQEYEKIIEEIKSNLTGEKEKDIKYLKQKAEEYKGHEYSEEILKEIGRLLYNYLPKKETENFADNIRKEILPYYQRGIKALNEKDNELAFKELEIFVQNAESLVKSDRVTKYVTPSKMLEDYLIYEDYREKGIKTVNLGLDISGAYFLLGYLSVEKNNLEDARRYLIAAMEWNPYNCQARFEFAEIYKIEKNIDMLYEQIMNIYKYIYDPAFLGRFYRDLGYYYIEKGNLALAKNIYVVSVLFSDKRDHYVIDNELKYINQLTNDDKIPSIEDAIGVIREAGIPDFFDQRIVLRVYDIYHGLKSRNQLETEQGKYITYIHDFYERFLGAEKKQTGEE